MRRRTSILALLAAENVQRPLLLHGFEATTWHFVRRARRARLSTRIASGGWRAALGRLASPPATRSLSLRRSGSAARLSAPRAARRWRRRERAEGGGRRERRRAARRHQQVEQRGQPLRQRLRRLGVRLRQHGLLHGEGQALERRRLARRWRSSIISATREASRIAASAASPLSARPVRGGALQPGEIAGKREIDQRVGRARRRRRRRARRCRPPPARRRPRHRASAWRSRCARRRGRG